MRSKMFWFGMIMLILVLAKAIAIFDYHNRDASSSPVWLAFIDLTLILSITCKVESIRQAGRQQPPPLEYVLHWSEVLSYGKSREGFKFNLHETWVNLLTIESQVKIPSRMTMQVKFLCTCFINGTNLTPKRRLARAKYFMTPRFRNF